jgi:hypothetical protein
LHSVSSSVALVSVPSRQPTGTGLPTIPTGAGPGEGCRVPGGGGAAGAPGRSPVRPPTRSLPGGSFSTPGAGSVVVVVLMRLTPGSGAQGTIEVRAKPAPVAPKGVAGTAPSA